MSLLITLFWSTACFALVAVLTFALVVGNSLRQIRGSRSRWAAIRAYDDGLDADQSALERFALIAEYVAIQANGDYAQFMVDMNNFVLGATSNLTAIVEAPLDRSRTLLHKRFRWFPPGNAGPRFGSSGFKADDGSNQPQHVWYSVAIRYSWGEALAHFEAWYHEYNGPGLLKHLPGSGHGHGTVEDYELSLQGIALGRQLARRELPLENVSDWLRRELGDQITELAPDEM